MVGSSYKIIDGLVTNVRASPTRLRIPPDSSEGYLYNVSSLKLTNASFSLTIGGASLGFILCCKSEY